MKKNIVAGAASLLLLAAALLAPRPQLAEAAPQSGERNAVLYRSTYTQTNETSSTTAKSGGVLGSIIISSVVYNASFIVYDSSDATTSGKEVLANVSCVTPGTYVFNVPADLGLSYASSGGCKATMTFLEHR